MELPDSHLSMRQILKRYKGAVLWSCFISLGAVNWGLDLLLSQGIIAVPSFQKNFGERLISSASVDYYVTYSWQTAFNVTSYIGGLFGAILSGYLADIIGKRWTLAGACILSIGAVFLQVFAHHHHPEILLIGKLLNGLTLGTFLTLPSAYASELCPTPLRGLSTSGVQLAISIGQLMANLILKGTGTLSSDMAYRIPFMLQWIFPVILLIGIPFAPESPWFLLKLGKPHTALITLRKLGYINEPVVIAEMERVTQLENKHRQSTTYLSCFQGRDLRRTEVAMGIVACSQLTGVVFTIGYSSYFFELAGLTASTSFSVSIGVSVLGLLGVVCSWFLINRTGRRDTSFWGLFGLMILLLLIGLLDSIPTSSKGPVYGQVACVVVFAFVYLLTIGPMSWSLFAEISSARLRSRTVGLGIVVQNFFGITMNVLVPLMINPDTANWGGKIGYLFAGTTALCLVWVWWRVPETKDRKLAELDWLFENKIKASEFEGFDIPPHIQAQV